MRGSHTAESYGKAVPQTLSVSQITSEKLRVKRVPD